MSQSTIDTFRVEPEINPCPHCNSRMVHTYHSKILRLPWVVECLECGLRGPYKESEIRAIEVWNLL